MTQKHYMDIERLKPAFHDAFRKGDIIQITEKIDGANFSIRYDAETNTVASFSRKKTLDFDNNLRGAYQWAQKLDVDRAKEVLGTRYILFMEWLCSHSVPYPEEKYQNAYAYDVYDTYDERYLPQDESIEIAKQLGVTYVPIFYTGEFTNWDDIMSYVGKTDMGGEYGEGIVVKSMTRLNDPNNRLPFYTKIVGEKFCETKAHKHVKVIDPEIMKEREEKQALTETVVTEARVTKMLHKFVDDGIIPEDWCEKDMGTIAKNIGRAIYNDCVKEEPETVESVGSTFGKYANQTSMQIVRKILADKNKF